jgi:hypothetical protein
MSLIFPSSSPRIAEPRLPEGSQEMPVIGWRTWRLVRVEDAVVLQSLFGAERWEVGTTRARCRCSPPWLASTHPVPVVSCGCGLHAFCTPSEAIRQAELQMGVSSFGRRQPTATAVGAIVAWGRVVQHGRQGWRAQFARPVALLDKGEQMLEEAASRYRLPLVSIEGLCVLPLEYGEALMGA